MHHDVVICNVVLNKKLDRSGIQSSLTCKISEMELLSATLKASLIVNVILEAVCGSIGLPVINLHNTLFTEYMNIVLISMTLPTGPTLAETCNDVCWKTEALMCSVVALFPLTYLITKPGYLIADNFINLVF